MSVQRINAGKINKGILIDKEKENIVFKVARFK